MGIPAAQLIGADTADLGRQVGDHRPPVIGDQTLKMLHNQQWSQRVDLEIVHHRGGPNFVELFFGINIASLVVEDSGDVQQQV